MQIPFPRLNNPLQDITFQSNCIDYGSRERERERERENDLIYVFAFSNVIMSEPY